MSKYSYTIEQHLTIYTALKHIGVHKELSHKEKNILGLYVKAFFPEKLPKIKQGERNGGLCYVREYPQELREDFLMLIKGWLISNKKTI